MHCGVVAPLLASSTCTPFPAARRSGEQRTDSAVEVTSTPVDMRITTAEVTSTPMEVTSSRITCDKYHNGSNTYPSGGDKPSCRCDKYVNGSNKSTSGSDLSCWGSLYHFSADTFLSSWAANYFIPIKLSSRLIEQHVIEHGAPKERWASTVHGNLTGSYRPIMMLCGPHSQLEVLEPAPACHHELPVRELVHPPAQPLTENPAKGTCCIPGHAMYWIHVIVYFWY